MFSIFYNKIIRKIVTSFGDIFSNITLVRYNNNGAEQQRLIVSCKFGGKEKYMQMLEGDPQSSRGVQVNLPLISYNIKNITYDSARKGQTMIQNFNVASGGGINTQYNAIPYNFDFELVIYTRTVEDGTQLLETILSGFTPDYTLRLNLVPTMNIVKDVPIVLNSVNYENDNEGDEDTPTRTVLWTLGFTVKGYLFGPIASGGIIKEAITRLYIEKTDPESVGYGSDIIQFVMSNDANGNYTTGEVVYQGNTLSYAKATAVVQNWSNTTSRLRITNVNGTFFTNTPIVGAQSGADHTIINYEITPAPVEIITADVVPPTANIGDNYTVMVTREFPLANN